MTLIKITASFALLSTAFAAPCTSEDRSGCVLGQQADGQATIANDCLQNLTSGTLPASLSHLCPNTESSTFMTSTEAHTAAPVTALPPLVPTITTMMALPATSSAVGSIPATILAISQEQAPPSLDSGTPSGQHLEVNVVLAGDPEADQVASLNAQGQNLERPVPTATTINGRVYAIVHPKTTIIDGATYVLPETVSSLSVGEVTVTTSSKRTLVVTKTMTRTMMEMPQGGCVQAIDGTTRVFSECAKPTKAPEALTPISLASVCANADDVSKCQGELIVAELN